MRTLNRFTARPARWLLSSAVALASSPLLPAAPAWAQEGGAREAVEAEESTTRTLREVSVSAGGAGGQGGPGNGLGTSDAASQGTVGAAAIAARPVLRTGEVLEFVPGLVVVQHSGGGKANQHFLRGINLDHGTEFATFVDGMPVNMRTHAHGQGYTDLNFLIPELVQRVDYRKGPYYA